MIRLIPFGLAVLALALPSSAQPPTPRLVADVGSDGPEKPCGSLPENAVSAGGRLAFGARPTADPERRIFSTDGSAQGTHELLPNWGGPQFAFDVIASGRFHVAIGPTSVDRDIVGTDGLGTDVDVLFSPPFFAFGSGVVDGHQLFRQVNPPSFWWSDGTSGGLTYSLVGGQTGSVSSFGSTDELAVVGFFDGPPSTTVYAIAPGQQPLILGEADGPVRVGLENSASTGGVDVAAREVGGTFTFHRVGRDGEGPLSASSTPTTCTDVRALTRINDEQLLFSGTCAAESAFGLHLLEAGQTTFLREAFDPPPPPILPIPTFPVRFEHPADRLLIYIDREDVGHESFVWNAVLRQLEPAVVLDHERLSPLLDTGDIRLFSGTLHGRSAIWSLLPGGALEEIASPPSNAAQLRVTAVGDRAVFYHDDGVIGRELWMTDGTAAGTQPLEVAPGTEGLQTPFDTVACLPRGFFGTYGSLPVLEPTPLRDELLFSGYRPDVGVELFAVPLDLFEEIDPPVEPGPCDAAEALCLQDGRFVARVEWTTASDAGQAVAVAPRTEDTGLFWFFQPDNWELMVKVLDACDVNGHFWTLVGGTTDVGWDLTIEDTETGAEWTASNAVGSRSPSLIEINALPCDL